MHRLVSFGASFLMLMGAGCGGSNTMAPSSSAPSPSTTTPTAPVSATGTWVGNSPDGVVFSSGGSCNADLTLVLMQNGASIAGTETAQSRTTHCAPVIFQSSDTATSTPPPPTQVTGTITGSLVSLTIVFRAFVNGVPSTVRGIAASGTIAGNRLSLTGSYLPGRTWTDFNLNGLVDCDLQNPATNAECGQLSQSAQSITVNLSR
jgi:hypothetical protein